MFVPLKNYEIKYWERRQNKAYDSLLNSDKRTYSAISRLFGTSAKEGGICPFMCWPWMKPELSKI
jgi:hypothetical protein